MRTAMASFLALAGAVLGTFPGKVFSQEGNSVALAFSGVFLGVRSIPETEQIWFAATQTQTGMVLSETRVEVTQVPNACSGNATRINAIDVREPVFLVRGSSAFRSGPLNSVFDQRRFIYPAEGLSLKLESGAWVGFQAYGSAAPAVGEVRVTDYEIRIYQGTRTQTLAQFPRIDWDAPPQVVWAGDLDRDGRLDALLDLRTHYVGHHYTLFLSSDASDEQLVNRVAEFQVGGC